MLIRVSINGIKASSVLAMGNILPSSAGGGMESRIYRKWHTLNSSSETGKRVCDFRELAEWTRRGLRRGVRGAGGMLVEGRRNVTGLQGKSLETRNRTLLGLLALLTHG